MKRAIALLDGFILTSVGLGAGCFAIWGDYWLIMNPGFKWLTISGAVFISSLGLTVMFNQPATVHYSRSVIFILLFLIVLFGRPYSSAINPTANMISPLFARMSPSAESGLANTRLSELYFSTMEETGTIFSDKSFTVVGMVKRLPEWDRAGYFAVMEYVMFCCAADALALGFLVPYDKTLELKDGGWVALTGRLKKLDTPISIPIFRFGSANFASVNEKFVIENEKVKMIKLLDPQ